MEKKRVSVGSEDDEYTNQLNPHATVIKGIG